MAVWCGRNLRQLKPALRIATVVLLLAVVAQPAWADMVTGHYTGDGAPFRPITGLSFQPAVVIIKGDLAEPAVLRADFHSGLASKQIGSPNNIIYDGITSLDADGFSVGGGGSVNASGLEYEWVAFSYDPGFLGTGFYNGDGSPNHNIFGVGFQPEVVIVLPHSSEPSTFRTIDMPDDFSTTFDSDGLFNNHIEYFASDMFRVGSDQSVNQPGDQYGYVAFNADAAKVVHGIYTGTGLEHDVGPIGFGPEYVIVKSAESKPAVHRSKTLSDPWSSYFWAEAHYDQGVIDMKGDGFKVGTSNWVNEPAKDYYYVAFKGVDRFSNLALSQVVDDMTPDEGQELTFDISLWNNNGPDDARNIEILVDLPMGLTHTGDSPGDGSFDSGTGIWSIPELKDDEIITLRVTATVDLGTGGQTLTTTSSVSSMDESDPDGSNNSASTDVVVHSLAQADLAVSASWDDTTPDEGQLVQLTVQVDNLGPDDAYSITVLVPLPTGLTFDSESAAVGTYDQGTGAWTFPALPVGNNTSLNIWATVDSGTAGSTLTVLPLIIGSEPPDTYVENNTATASLTVSNAELMLAITVDDPAPDEGQDITHYVVLTNNGPDVATDIKVDLTFPADLVYQSDISDPGIYNQGQSDWTIPSLGVGLTAQLRVVSRVNAGTGGQTLTTLADITEVAESDANGSNNSASVDVVITSADLAVAIGVNDSEPDEGQQVIYTIGLENQGPDDATSTAVEITLPPGLTYVSDIPGNGTYNSGTGLWTIGPVAATGVASLQIAASVDLGTAGSTLTTTAAVLASDQSDPDSANNSASVDVFVPVIVPVADLLVGIGVDNNAPEMGQQVTYTIGLVNLGPGDATGTEVTVTLPAGITYVSDTPLGGTFNSGNGVWTLGPISAAGSAQLQVVASVDTGTEGSTLTTLAGITAAGQIDPNFANNSSSVDVTVPVVLSADLAVSLVADETSAIEAQQVVFTLDLDNQGPDDATGTKVTLVLPVGLTYVSDVPGTGTYNNGTGVWTVGPLIASGNAQLQVTTSVDAGTSGSTLNTSAAVSASDLDDPNGANDSAGVGVDILSSANLGVTAAFDLFNPLPGDPSVLTVVVTNAGPNTASGIQVDMDLAPELSLDGVSPTNGSWDGGTGAWTLPSLAPLATETLVFDLTVGDVPGGTELTGTAAISSLNEIDPDVSDNTAVATMIVLGPGEVRLVAEPFEDSHRTLLPGGPPEEVLRLALINDSVSEERLRSVTISNPVTGSFDQATQDAAWGKVELTWSLGAKADLEPEHVGDFVNGQLTFAGLDIGVKPGATLHLVVSGVASIDAADGLVLQPTINSTDDIVFTSAVFLEGTWPIVAPGALFVDGMTAPQITLHEVGAVVFQIGSGPNLAMDFTLPANGGVPDTLTKLNILNTGTANYPDEIERMECWADDGDGVFNSAVDKNLAELRWTGGQRFEATALTESVPATGLRVFVTVDIAADALGGNVQLSLPTGDDLGVGMASDNDGPIDTAVTNQLAQTISATDRVIFSAGRLNSSTVAPGQSQVPMLHMVARNLYTDNRTVNQLILTNVTVGDPVAGRTELDGSVAQLKIQLDSDQDGELDGEDIDLVIASASWEDGTATFDGMGWALVPDLETHLFITGNIDLLGAANGDLVGAVVSSAQDFQFDMNTAVGGSWPVDSGARYEVDGMVAAQVGNHPVTPVSLTINEGPVLAFDFTIPGNGYLDDTLQTLRLENLGTAVPGDIAALELFDDQNGNGIFEPGTDPKLADFAFVGQNWVVLDIALPVPAAGRRLFAGLTVASTPTDAATVNLSIPQNGADMVSGNDGPNDGSVDCGTTLLMSTAPLLSNLAFAYDLSTTEMNATLTMTAKNVGGEDLVDIVPQNLVVTGDGAMNLISGPQPATLDLAQGAEGTFSWEFAGTSQGPVTATGNAEGEGAASHNPRVSLPSPSGTHLILDPAVDLDLYPVANMPFSINRGQTGVVPMTLTLLNPGGPDRANLRLEQLVVTLGDGDGNPVVPDQLLSHVTVNEGANVFCDLDILESTGQTMTLALDPPVVVTDSEPVTLGLRLDILSSTEVDRFRVILQNASDLTVVDNVSGLPRTVQLTNDSFPVMSAAGSIVSQANGLVVSAPVQPDFTAGAGQLDVTMLQLELAGSGEHDDSEVKVGGFSVMVVDTLGQALPDASAYLEQVWVEGPLGRNDTHLMSGAADSLVVFELQPQITVPVGSDPVAISIHGELKSDSTLGPLHIRLGPTNSFDARDGNNSADVLVTYQPAEITGPRVTVQEPATELLVAISGELPEVTALGATDVLAMTVNLEHPGPGTAASVRLDSLRLDCLDLNRQPQDPDAILDGYRMLFRGVDLGVPVFYQNGQIVVPLGGQLLDPFTQGDLELRLDVEANAPAGGFELVVQPTGITAFDNNLETPVPLVAAPGFTLPAGSNLTQLQPPSEDVVADWDDRMPPLLPTGDELVEAMHLVLTNPAPIGAAPAELHSLVLRTANRSGQTLVAGSVLSGVQIEFAGNVWAEISDPADSDTTLTLELATPLILHPDVIVPIVIKVSGTTGAAADGLSLGLLDGDVICVQPGSTSQIDVIPAAGETFPFWTAAAGLGQAALAESYINFPNPFAAGRDQTNFAFNLDQPATVTLCVWTSRGETVITLLNNKALSPGLYQDLVWDGRNGTGQVVRNGVYLAELKVQYQGGGSERLLRKVAVVR